ncbi:AMP-binding protein [[Clostridium] polysaccharolyticum]|uniref:AMP-binding enzyme C-terminal domain-containing protein n=1 Tax=[Clostridium] polysaccharolyticum TaxID=29364 RepID=A0A1I0EJF9_9FIRM|nr:AMP-binding protein [[Clostridium] polysaccharolyticum]SET45085.1 AMP-binding enzyme C-terminal domain-containing protein [[Clostridium] polysaccharolyticum]
MIYEKIPEQFNASQYLLEHDNLGLDLETKVALYYNDVAYTYRDLNTYVNKYANYYLKSNISAGDAIVLYMQDCPEFVFLFLGALKAGVIPVLINHKMSGMEVEEIAGRTDAIKIFTNSGLFESLKETGVNNIARNYEELKDEIYSMPDCFQAAVTKKDDEAFVLFTSGSSGIPKGAVHSHADIAVAAETYGKYVLDTNSSDVFYTHSKMSFAYGLGGLYIPLSKGASLVINSEDDMYDIPDIIKKYHVTKFQAVPSVYLSLLMLINEDKTAFASCKICTSSGESLPKKLAIDWKNKTGLEVYQCYGSTEMLTVVISNTADTMRYGSMGKAIKGYMAEIRNKEGQLAKPLEAGTLFVKGGSLMSRYWKNDKLTKEVLTEHGINTGDMCYKDEDGFLWYVGRYSDIFKVNGVWQSALPIEEVILEEPGIKEAVVTTEASDGESKIVAYAVAKELHNCEEMIKKIRKLFFQKKMRTLCPEKYYFVEAIPRGNTGKVKRGDVNSSRILLVVE